MSAKRGPPKKPQEDYCTPAWVVESLLDEVQLPGGRWLEPCAGDGAIIRAVSARRSDVAWAACEIREECRDPLVAIPSVERAVIGDFFEPASLSAIMDLGQFDVIITNPPYSVAEDFVNVCLPLAKLTIMLLRLPFLEGAERAVFWRKRMPNVYVLPNRPSFTGGGTDATAYAWFIWHGHDPREYGVIRVLEPVPAEKRRSRTG